MKTRTKLAGLAVAVHLLTVSLAFSAGQSSQNYQISAEVFVQGAGGTTVFSTSYKMSGSIGQYAVVGAAVTSASYKVETGFQAAIVETGGGAAPEAYDDWASGIAWAEWIQLLQRIRTETGSKTSRSSLLTQTPRRWTPVFTSLRLRSMDKRPRFRSIVQPLGYMSCGSAPI